MKLLQYVEMIGKAGEFASQRYRVSDEMRILCAAVEKWDLSRQREIDDLKKKVHAISTAGQSE